MGERQVGRERGARGVNVLEHPSSTPLMRAVLEGESSRRIESLLQENGTAEYTNAQREDGATALLLAVRMQRFDVVRSLLKFHADPTICAHGWRWDAPRAIAFGGDELPVDHLRQLERASPLTVALMTRLRATGGQHAELMRHGGDKIVRALVFCGAMNARLGDGDSDGGEDESDDEGSDAPSSATEEIQQMAMPVLSQVELGALVQEEGAEYPGVVFKRLLGFDPLERLEPWMRQSDQDWEDDARDKMTSIMSAVADRVGDTSHLSETDLFVSQMFHQLAHDPEHVVRKFEELGVTAATQDAGNGMVGAMAAVASFLTADHAGRPLREVKMEGISCLTALAGPTASVAHLASLATTFAHANSTSKVLECMRTKLSSLEQAALERGGNDSSASGRDSSDCSVS